MKKTILEIYALAVCFITVTCFVVCFGILGYSVVQISSPDFTMNSHEYNKYQSNDSYWMDCGTMYCSDNDKKKVRPTEDVLTKERTDKFTRQLATEKRDGTQTLVKTLIVMLVDALAFMIHWIIARKARASAA